MKKFLASCIALCAIVGVASAVTVTNQGQVITINTMEDNIGTAGNANDWDQSSLFTAPRQGYIVATFDVAEHGGAIGAKTFGVSVPKGAVILGDDTFIEVNTKVLPVAASTNAITLGGITIASAATNLLTESGIQATAVTAPTITTSAGQLTLTTTGAAVTQGVFTVYLPIMWGNAR